VRKALPAEAVLIEISRFDVHNIQVKGGERFPRGLRYAAWVVPPTGQGEVHLVDLGPAEPIEDAVRTIHDALQQAPTEIRKQGEPDAEQQIQKPLRALATLVLQPLAEHLDPKKRWILSPDASLWLVPWAALPLANGKYAVEEHEIRYVVSGRDLVAA